MALLENREGMFVTPGPAAGQAAFAGELDDAGSGDLVQLVSDPDGSASYPIVTLTWALVNRHYLDARKAEAVKAFLNWALGEGQPIAESLQYVTLPTGLAAAAQASLATIE